mmetsp:Transcript_7297/g.15765  ORF Transcript_7297/g.15765 Transcript_7297/m.15765 type:complete len:238 (-) Transcript_7297:245-958(-)
MILRLPLEFADGAARDELGRSKVVVNLCRWFGAVFADRDVRGVGGGTAVPSLRLLHGCCGSVGHLHNFLGERVRDLDLRGHRLNLRGHRFPVPVFFPLLQQPRAGRRRPGFELGSHLVLRHEVQVGPDPRDQVSRGGVDGILLDRPSLEIAGRVGDLDQVLRRIGRCRRIVFVVVGIVLGQGERPNVHSIGDPRRCPVAGIGVAAPVRQEEQKTLAVDASVPPIDLRRFAGALVVVV